MHLNPSITGTLELHWSVSVASADAMCGSVDFTPVFSLCPVSWILRRRVVMVNLSQVYPTLLLLCVFLEFQVFSGIKCTCCHFGLVQQLLLLCSDTNSLSLECSFKILFCQSRRSRQPVESDKPCLCFSQDSCYLDKIFISCWKLLLQNCMRGILGEIRMMIRMDTEQAVRNRNLGELLG